MRTDDALRDLYARYEQGHISELDRSRAKTEVETKTALLYQTRAYISRDARRKALKLLPDAPPKDIKARMAPCSAA